MMGDVEWREVEVQLGWGTLRGKKCVVGGESNVGGGTCSGGGSGLQVVCVHELLDNANSWETLAPWLPCGTQVLALDMPGHGLSDYLPPGAHYSLVSHALTLRRTLDSLGWARPVLLGHGMGAAVALLFAAIFPLRVAAVVSLDFIQYPRGGVSGWRQDALELTRLEQASSTASPVVNDGEALTRVVTTRRNGRTNKDSTSAKKLIGQRAGHEGGLRGLSVDTYDPRVTHTFDSVLSGRFWLEVLGAVVCPVLLVVASHGHCTTPVTRHYKNALNAFRTNAQWFTFREVEGPHHLHQSHPHRLHKHLAKFLSSVQPNIPTAKL